MTSVAIICTGTIKVVINLYYFLSLWQQFLIYTALCTSLKTYLAGPVAPAGRRIDRLMYPRKEIPNN